MPAPPLQVTVNGVTATESNHKQGYVQQEDVFYSQLTVLETLSMAAELRLPSSMSAAARSAYVEQLMAVLGLAKVRDTVVGDAKTRGLSGGGAQPGLYRVQYLSLIHI